LTAVLLVNATWPTPINNGSYTTYIYPAKILHMNKKAESSGLYIFTATQLLFMSKILLQLGQIALSEKPFSSLSKTTTF